MGLKRLRRILTRDRWSNDNSPHGDTVIAGGFDPGLAKSAVAIVGREGSRLSLLHRALITTKPDQPDMARFRTIWAALSEPIRKYHPTVIGIEDQSGVSVAARMQGKRAAEARSKGNKAPGGAGFNSNNDGVLSVVGLAKGAAIAYGTRYKMLHPQTIKIAVLGKGGRSGKKADMIAAVKALFPELRMPGVKLSEHEADAIAMAILALRVDAVGVAA